jgi:hypothetical protein
MNTPEKIHQFLMKSVFKAALKRETKLTNAVEKFTGNLRFDGEELIFTLPALFKFAIGYIQEESITQISDKQVEYLAFRKIVYQSGINLQLRSLQAAVVIESQHVNHDERWYRLVVLQ